jgi:hypothetical protein
VHRRFTRWAKSGVWKRIFQQLAVDADNEYAMIDCTIAPAHQHSAGTKKAGRDQAIEHSRGGLSAKIHTTVDALGNPTGFHLTGGAAPDGRRRPSGAGDTGDTLLADERVLQPLAAAGKIAVIPRI